jgi:hypothetical protein
LDAEAVGRAGTATVWEWLSDAPVRSRTVRRTVYVPGAAYACEGFAWELVPPSPNVQEYEKGAAPPVLAFEKATGVPGHCGEFDVKSTTSGVATTRSWPVEHFAARLEHVAPAQVSGLADQLTIMLPSVIVLPHDQVTVARSTSVVPAERSPAHSSRWRVASPSTWRSPMRMTA